MKYSYIYRMFISMVSLFLLGCCKKEISFPDWVVYRNGPAEIEKKFKDFGLDPKRIAAEELVKSLKRFKDDGLGLKSGHTLVYLSTTAFGEAVQKQHQLPTEKDALDAWSESFEKGKAWCDYDLFFKDKIVSFEVEPKQVREDNIFSDGRSDKVISYFVYLRKEGQSGALNQDNSLTLVFEGHSLKSGNFVGFSIDRFVGHCPIIEVDADTQEQIDRVEEAKRRQEAEGKL